MLAVHELAAQLPPVQMPLQGWLQPPQFWRSMLVLTQPVVHMV
jgi:hypothetical protein